jgi:Ion channel
VGTLIEHLLASALAMVLVLITVAMHYEALRFLGRTLGAHVHKRIGVLLVMLGLLVAHALEIWVFAFGYMFANWAPNMGYIAGIDAPDAFDYMYLSSMVYATVGFGDLVPVGAMRMISAAEALTGLALITWSASFTFLAMQKFWPAALSDDRS